MEPMKISFGFGKRVIKPNVIRNMKEDKKKVEFIECLEGQSIKVKDAIEEVEQPLIIPLKDEHNNLLDRVRAAKKRDKPLEQKDEANDNRPDSELTDNELAARQLMREAKDRLANNGFSKNNGKISVLPCSEGTTTQEGEKEPTLEDYESVPISDYGLAMLRGMGWKEGMPIGKKSSKSAAVSVPELRPKGLGLGAEKIVKPEIQANKALDQDGNELVLRKGCVAKMIGGPKKGNYCEVQGFDEEAGRVIIQVHPKGELLNINESLILPVTKEEFSKQSKAFGLQDASGRNSNKSPRNQNRNKLKAPSRNRLSENDYYEEEKKEDTKSDDRSRSYFSSKYKSSKTKSKDHSPTSSSSNDDSYFKDEKVETKYMSKHSGKKDTRYPSDEKNKITKRHSKSKDRDRSRSYTRDEHRKHKQNRDNRDSSEDGDDDKREKRKKNKCKSRHRRSSSSSK